MQVAYPSFLPHAFDKEKRKEKEIEKQ